MSLVTVQGAIPGLNWSRGQVRLRGHGETVPLAEQALTAGFTGYILKRDITLRDMGGYVARQSRTKWAILGILTMQPSSGYDIKKFSEDVLSHFWNESYGNLYPVLKRMLAAGLVTSTTERQAGRPDRIVYSMLPRGRAAFEEWLAADVEPEPVRSELLLKLFFARHLPSRLTRRHLERFREQQKGLLETYESVRAELEDMEDSADRMYRLMTLRRGLLVAKARLQWTQEALETLDDVSEGRKK